MTPMAMQAFLRTTRSSLCINFSKASPAPKSSNCFLFSSPAIIEYRYTSTSCYIKIKLRKQFYSYHIAKQYWMIMYNHKLKNCDKLYLISLFVYIYNLALPMNINTFSLFKTFLKPHMNENHIKHFFYLMDIHLHTFVNKLVDGFAGFRLYIFFRTT